MPIQAYAYQNDILESDYPVNDTNETAGRSKAAYVARTVTNSKMTDKQKIKAVHDWLCKHCTYRDETQYLVPGFGRDTEDTDGLPEGPLIYGYARCEGYARAFDLIMEYCNIPCVIVVNDDHSWNTVTIGNAEYDVDVTWDDCTSSYDYFLTPSYRTKKLHGTYAYYNNAYDEFLSDGEEDDYDDVYECEYDDCDFEWE
jgi:transglutaminase/protease-like cytokinesis protein 3